MAGDEVHFLNILKGKRVKLTLKNSAYFGVVQRINPNKTLVLTDVSGSNGVGFPGSKLFFGHEIINVEFSNEAKPDHGKVQDQTLEHLNIEKFQSYRKNMTWDEEEENINFEVIDEFHGKFVPAVMHIKKKHVIGLGVDGVEVFKHGRLCWLQISTKNKVYLFDILSLGARAFKNGLSMILENKHILKVIHDCRAVAGCLFAQFGVTLTNVFDTQVADVMFFYSETGGLLPDRVSSLEEVVSLHLKVPSSQLQSLQMKTQLTKEEREMWQKRPCPVPLLKVMALSVIHLQPLRLVLLDALMMDYMTLVDSYLKSSHFQPDELEPVTMESLLELPKVLRQIEQTRCEKQEWAAAIYPVTEKGLLDRFNPRPQTPSNTSPAEEQHGQTDTEPENVKSPVDLSRPKPPPSPSEDTNVPSLDIPVSSQVPSVAASTDLSTHTPAKTPPIVGVGRGCTELLTDATGGGRPLGTDSTAPSVSALPAVGRGFLLQTSQFNTPRGSAGDHGPPQEAIPHKFSDPPKDTSGSRTPKPLASSPSKSFRPFSF